MPAASDGVGLILPHTFRPLGPRIVGIVLGAAVTIVFVVGWFSFPPETRAKFTVFQIGTLIFLFALAGSCMYALIRSRAVATRDGVTVVNGYRKRQIGWEQIVAVRLPTGAPWVTMDLSDGTTVSVMAIQSSDGMRARQAALQLRALATELPH